MKKSRTLIAALPLLSLLSLCHAADTVVPAPAASSNTGELPQTVRVGGVVDSLDPALRTVTLRDKSGNRSSYVIADNAAFTTRNNDNTDISQVRVGDSVVVRVGANNEVDNVKVVPQLP